MNTLYIFFAKYLFVVPPALLAYIWLRSSTQIRRTLSLRMLIAFVLTFGLGKACRLLIQSPRPFVALHLTPLIQHSADNSFPSDHSLLTFACAFLIFPFSPRLGSAALICAILVGIGRVMCLVHWPADILGSAVFALIGAAVGYAAVKQQAALSTVNAA